MLEAARSHYRRQQRLAASAVSLSRGAWRLLDRHALDATVGRFLARMLPALTSSQAAAAQLASAYTRAALTEQGIDADLAGEVRPDALAGIASDGRPLESLLASPVRTVKLLSARGVPVDQAMRSGLSRLERIAATQVADAGRVATGVAVAATSRAGYVRMLNTPSCSRCVILAGRFYRYNAGFARHPLDDCIHVPATEDTAGDLRTDPAAYFASLPEAEQERIFTKAGAQAIRDGADLSQVVNARRGMSTAAGPSGRRRLAPEDVLGQPTLITREGITRRGVAGSRLGDGSRGVRLMPEAIYRDATSRAEAIRLLMRFGYITD